MIEQVPALVARHHLKAHHLVHVGAHEGQEVPHYRQVGFERITLIEPIPELARRLRREHPDADVVECACAAAPGQAVLHVMRRTNMSTLVEPAARDDVTRTIEVRVRRLDEIAPDANVAVIDAQGLELQVLQTAPLHRLDLAIVETCTVDDPTMASPHQDVADLMAGAGFVEVDRRVRDYDRVNRWARGRSGITRTGGEIRDIAYLARRCMPA